MNVSNEHNHFRADRGAPMVGATDLNKAFKGVRAVDQLNLCIKPGEVYGLLGPNGAGMTWICRIYYFRLTGELSGGVISYEARRPLQRIVI